MSPRRIHLPCAHSTTQDMLDKFCLTVSDLTKKYISSKMLKGNKVKKPWINRTVRSLIRRCGKLFRKMKISKKENHIQKFKESKKDVQKAEIEMRTVIFVLY